MHFRTKDLLVTVLPRSAGNNPELEKRCLLHTRICTAPTFCVYTTCMAGGSVNIPCPHNTYRAWMPTDPCPHLSTIITWTPCTPLSDVFGTCPKNSARLADMCAPVSQDPWVINDKEDLEVLRAELNETLDELKKLEKTLPSGLVTKENAKAVVAGLDEVITQIKKAASHLK